MAGSVNKVILVGRLGRDPESRAMPSGGNVVSFSLATSETWNDKTSGERKEKTQWHRISIFNDRIGETAMKYLKKGNPVYIEGSLESRKYTDQAGVEKETTEIIIGRFRGELTLLDGRAAGGGGEMADSGGYQARQPARAAAPARSGGGTSWEPNKGSDLDDDIPF